MSMHLHTITKLNFLAVGRRSLPSGTAWSNNCGIKRVLVSEIPVEGQNDCSTKGGKKESHIPPLQMHPKKVTVQRHNDINRVSPQIFKQKKILKLWTLLMIRIGDFEAQSERKSATKGQ
jgi:hypothetical protein